MGNSTKSLFSIEMLYQFGMVVLFRQDPFYMKVFPMQASPNILLKSIFVPGWIYRALMRSQRSATELNNYTEVRKFLTLDDIAEWVHLNNGIKINGMYFNEILLQSIFTDLSSQEKAELDNTVSPLSYTEKTANSVTTRLMSKRDDLSTASVKSDYEFVTADNTIYVILNEGFFTMCQDRDKLFGFIQNYLKTCYSMTSIADVSKMAVYKAYIKHLAN